MPGATHRPLDALAEATECMCGKVEAMHRQLVVMRIWVAIATLIIAGAAIVNLIAVVG
jgi:hypothetical protein